MRLPLPLFTRSIDLRKRPLTVAALCCALACATTPLAGCDGSTGDAETLEGDEDVMSEDDIEDYEAEMRAAEGG
ncbi:hypothetical protein [Alienimonas sp. DA493]|uniref:hypothetical protein n=1 Tax=Alienimonas sp. DA493 TaxID=3373605 RepID=UPI003754B15D